LIDASGKVIGISTAKFSLDKNDEIGINFATPIDVVKEVFDEIIKHGRVVRNWIGLNAVSLNRAGHRILSPGVEFGIGLVVSGTQPNSPAEEAGLQYKDLLTHYNGQLITSGEQFRKLFMLTPIDKSVKITYIRNKISIDTHLNLREEPKK
jgi:serine protease DegS